MTNTSIPEEESSGEQEDKNTGRIIVSHSTVPQLKSILNHRGIHMTMNALKAFKMFKEPLHQQRSRNKKL